uniref:Hexosyltransferase n=1 Tax=Knipowitschia caucasica TaxID=637954 RepID=A0AAV2JDI3_KNICA
MTLANLDDFEKGLGDVEKKFVEGFREGIFCGHRLTHVDEHGFSALRAQYIGEIMKSIKKRFPSGDVSHISDLDTVLNASRFPNTNSALQEYGLDAVERLADFYGAHPNAAVSLVEKERMVLRQTWAEERSYRGKTIRRVFISGTRGSGEERRHLDQLLQEEGRTYGDLLQWDFTDSFYNLTLKQLLFLDWFQTRSRRCRFLMSGDDDIFANTDNMVEFLLSRHGNDGDQHLFVGESDGSV